jgi:hypothetical protein
MMPHRYSSWTARHPSALRLSQARGLSLKKQAGAGSAFLSDTLEHPMIRSPQHSYSPEPRRDRITLAVITGVLSGVSRAVVSWFLDQLTTGN